MENTEKQQIADRLRDYVGTYDSQNKAANSLKDVSAATVSHMINGKWDLIKNEMWRNVSAQIGGNYTQVWQIAETTAGKLLNGILTDAQTHSNVFAAIGKAGLCKTSTMKMFAKRPNAYRLQCSEFWNRKYFLVELLKVMGFDSSGLTIPEMMQEVVKRLMSKKTPLIMLDEFDKVTDQVLYFFITIYNELEDHCGIMLCATDHLRKRILKGVALNKKGYNEIYSRIGRKFIELPDLNYTDVVNVCAANGVEDRKLIKEVWEDCDGDLRRVKRKIHALKNQKPNGD
ncbi:ATPase [Flavobacterium rivuli WB 3.3-2 = DSM 21788]|uniref:ATPase n=1 Tax=Flavobacterium rivuli WB 3.3-2 = DSM 21788 TaxID=1121895 RepID=A0A0A2M808_9FLAO|nr:AAA family ATPase [Flavobacterium rivuli]KGO88414.1 ATPase [Flavobacterium rivuli WB 3.3-2 = DSM 21788]